MIKIEFMAGSDVLLLESFEDCETPRSQRVGFRQVWDLATGIAGREILPVAPLIVEFEAGSKKLHVRQRGYRERFELSIATLWKAVAEMS